MIARLTPSEALIYVMITTSAVDREISDVELARIGSLVRELPVFQDHDSDWMVEEAQACGKLLAKPDGLAKVLDLVKDALPPHLYETAYLFATDIAATDLRIEAEEVRFLELLAEKLGLDKLVCSALERAARARHQTVNKTTARA